MLVRYMQALENCEREKAAVYELLGTGMVGRPAQEVLQGIMKKISHDITKILQDLMCMEKRAN